MVIVPLWSLIILALYIFAVQSYITLKVIEQLLKLNIISRIISFLSLLTIIPIFSPKVKQQHTDRKNKKVYNCNNDNNLIKTPAESILKNKIYSNSQYKSTNNINPEPFHSPDSTTEEK